MKKRSCSTWSLSLVVRRLACFALLVVAVSGPGCNPGPGRAAKAMLHLHRGNQLVEQGKIPEAVDEFRKAVELHPDNSLARMKLANNLMRMRQFQEAIEHLKRIEQADPTDRAARETLARAFEAMGMWEEAITRYEHLIFAEPSAWQLKLNLGQLYQTIGRFVAAQREFALLMKERPHQSEAYNAMGHLYAKYLQSTAEAVECFERAAKLWPGNFMALYNLGLTHSNWGDEKGAEQYFRKALEVMPGFTFSHLQLGLIEEKRGKDAEAEAHFKMAALDARSAPFALTRLAMRMIANGKAKEAVLPLQTAASLRQEDIYPWEDSAQYLLADLLLAEGKDKQAVVCLERAVRFNAGAYKAMAKLAKIYQKSGDQEKAKEFSESAKDMERKTLASKKAAKHFANAMTAYRSKDMHKAEAEGLASNTAQENLDAMMLLGRIAFEAGKMDEAEKWFSAACARQPLSGMANAYRGLILSKRGKQEDACKVLCDAASIRPYDTSLNLTLGRVALGMKKHKEALDAYHMALAIDPNVKGAKEGLAATYKALGKADPEKLAQQDIAVAKEKAKDAQDELDRRLKAVAEQRAQARARAKAEQEAQAAAKAKRPALVPPAAGAPEPNKTPEQPANAPERSGKTTVPAKVTNPKPPQ